MQIKTKTSGTPDTGWRLRTHTHSCTHAHTLLVRTGADLHGGNTKGHNYCVSPLGPQQPGTTGWGLTHRPSFSQLWRLKPEVGCQRGGEGPRSGRMAKWLWVPPIRSLIPFMGPTLTTSPPPKGLPQHLHLGLGLQCVGGGTNIQTLGSCSGKGFGFSMTLNYTHRVTRQCHSLGKWTLISTGTCAHVFTAARSRTANSGKHPNAL